MDTGRITQLTSLPKPDWVKTGSNPQIMLDEAEQKRADEALRERYKQLDLLRLTAKFEDGVYAFLLHVKNAVLYASPEDFQLLKHAAQAIADKYKL